MEKQRIGNDIRLKIKLLNDGEPVDLTTITVEQVCIYEPNQQSFAGACKDLVIHTDDPTTLNALYAAGDQHFTGKFNVVLQCIYNGHQCTFDAPAFELTATSAEAAQPGEPEPPVEVGLVVSDVNDQRMLEILRLCQAATVAANEAAATANTAAETALDRTAEAVAAAEAAAASAERCEALLGQVQEALEDVLTGVDYEEVCDTVDTALDVILGEEIDNENTEG